MLLSFIWLHERIEESMEASGALKNKKPFLKPERKQSTSSKNLCNAQKQFLT